MKILAFGNPLIKEDSLALEVARELEKEGYAVEKCYSSRDLLYFAKEEMLLLDTVEKLRTPKILKTSEIKNYRRFSAHDLDLSLFLQLLKPRAKIIGIPQKGNPKKIAKKVILLMRAMKLHL